VEVDKWLVANSDQSITIRSSPWRRPARVPGGGGDLRVCLAVARRQQSASVLGGGFFYLVAAMRAAELRNRSTGCDVTC
jgi:hypothetical protein